MTKPPGTPETDAAVFSYEEQYKDGYRTKRAVSVEHARSLEARLLAAQDLNERQAERLEQLYRAIVRAGCSFTLRSDKTLREELRNDRATLAESRLAAVRGIVEPLRELEELTEVSAEHDAAYSNALHNMFPRLLDALETK